MVPWYATQEGKFGGLGGSMRACQYCKYQCYKADKGIEQIRKRLSDETGVDLGAATAGQFLLESDFPYLKFLKNSNDEIKEYYRERFKNI